MLSVCVFFLIDCFLRKVDLELFSLDIKSFCELFSGFLKGFIKCFVVVFNLSIKSMLSINFSLSESVSQFLANCIKFSSLDFTEGFEFVSLDVKGISESLSSLANGFSNGGRLGFEELDEMEFIVGVMYEVDLLEFAILGGIESSLFLKERVFESCSLSIRGINERCEVVVKSVLECSRISDKTVMESSSLAVKGVGKGLSCISKCSVLSSLHVFDDNLHVGESFINSILESILFGNDEFFKFKCGLWVNVCIS